jgi:A/G-specific adenine glycosylase
MTYMIEPLMAAVFKIRAHLLDWYDANRRDLPWRASPGARSDPYRVWLSEIMLQQTTVPHATPYFLAFTARWPTVDDLAAAEDGEVMAAWAGLGYYARARNLLACARVVARDHAGVFPETEAGLRDLPGVGPYTAAAVAAIAFDQACNVVDGNVERVVARLFAVETPLPAAKGELTSLAATLVRPERAGDWAQALMDLGATVCRPAAPLCERCPVAALCRARALGDPAAYPRRTAKAERPHRQGAVFRLIDGDRVALVRRPPKGLLGGMLALPTTPWRAEPWTAAEAFDSAPTLRPGAAAWRPAGAVEHVFTHFSLSLAIYEARGTSLDASLIWTPIPQALVETPTVFSKALWGLTGAI